jgi:hypothetical protein
MDSKALPFPLDPVSALLGSASPTPEGLARLSAELAESRSTRSGSGSV